MTHVTDPETPRLVGLTALQFENLKRVWSVANFPPAPGFAGGIIAIAVDLDTTLVDTLSAVDFDDEKSVAEAADALTCWRQRTFR